MKKLTTFNPLGIGLAILVLLLSSIPLFSQEDTQITDGNEYWFGVPHCKKSSTEQVRWGSSPIQLWISSKVITKGYYESADGTTIMRTPFSVGPDNPKIIRIPDNLMQQTIDIEIVGTKGIHIVADDPISVGVFIAYKWSGEAWRVIPMEWCGTKYFTLNMYQDYCRMSDGTDDYKPCQILITATEDNTSLIYRPTCETTAGIKAGTTGKAVLMKGQTFLIEAKVFADRNQLWSTDLTGTYIEASNKISVISGHTKGAFPRYSKSLYGIRSDFMRNMLCDMMWPVELLGTEYISAPIKYADRPVMGLVPDDAGDIIRFVATQDNTVVYQMLDGWKQISPTLKTGQKYDLLSMAAPGYFRSNLPLLVGQYGKAWLSDLPPPITQDPNSNNIVTSNNDKDGDTPLNPHRNGQGMMFPLSPIDHWTTTASFRSADGMDAFVYVTFRAKDLDSLKFDNEFFKTKFGSAVKYIQGSEYAYVTEQISTGVHFIDGLHGATFAGYAYGNWDQSKDGFAYGYPVGVNYASKCDDSLYVKDKSVCGTVTGQVFAVDLQKDTSCASLFSITFKGSQSYNYKYIADPLFKSGDKTAKFTLEPINIQDSAIAVLKFMTRSGKTITKTYTYYPEIVVSDPTLVNFGILKMKDTVPLTFDVINKGLVDAYVKELKFRKGLIEFTFITKPWPFTLAPGAKKTITVSATPKEISNLPVEDSIIAVLTCFETPINNLFMQTSDPSVYIGDADFGCQPVGKETMKTVSITNQADADVVVNSGPEWPDHSVFTRTSMDANVFSGYPLTIKKGGSYEFQVYFTPNASNPSFTQTAWFNCNTQKTKLWSDWKGCGINAGPMITGKEWGKLRVIDTFNTVKYYEDTIQISCVGNSAINFESLVIDATTNPGNIFTFVPPSITKLQPNTSYPVVVRFAPAAEQNYASTITLTTSFDGNMQTKEAQLTGTGALPHIKVVGNDFRPAIVMGNTKSGKGNVQHVTIQPSFTWPLTIFDLKIQAIGADNCADCFQIDQTWYNDNIVKNNNKLIIPIGGSIDVPVIYNGKNAGVSQAHLVSSDDAPFTTNDIHSEVVIGEAYKITLASTDKDYKTIFKALSREGTVTFSNLSSIPVTVDDPIQLDMTGDYNYFSIDEVSTNLQGVISADKYPLQLQPLEVVTVKVTFSPMAVKNYHSTITYHSSTLYGKNTDYISNLIGVGIDLHLVSEVPKGYEGVPGQTPGVLVEYKLYTDPVNETKLLEDGNLLGFKAYVTFKTPNTVGSQDVFPVMDATNTNVVIEQKGTMTEGWTIVESVIQSNGIIYVNMIQNDPTKPLKKIDNNNTLFRFRMNAYISTRDKVNLPCYFEPVDNAIGGPDNKPAEYTIVNTIPGDITIKHICVNQLRLIQLTGAKFAVEQNEPNPASNMTKINYSVGFDVPTNISLYNSYGEKVVTLLNQSLAAGDYELSVNVNLLGLSSGVYFYKIDCGTWSETKSMVITR